MTARRLNAHARRIATAVGTTGHALDQLTVSLAMAAPFLSSRDLERWTRRLAAWRQTADAQAAQLDRVAQALTRYTPRGRPDARRVQRA
jgi:hypothetical protein